MADAPVTLTRTKFEPRPEVVLPELFTRAKTKLGYSPTAAREGEVRERRREQEVVVARALEKLGIEPLSKDSVERYKAQQVERITRKGSSRFVRYMHSRNGERTVFFVGLVGIFSLVVLLMLLVGMNELGKPMVHREFFLGGFRTWAGLAATWGMLMYARHKKVVTYSAEWKGEWLASYRQPVPEFALERALQIEELLPDANFFVHQLVETRQHVRMEVTPSPDPFLVLAYGDVRVYLDVWDEPKFEGRRTV